MWMRSVGMLAALLSLIVSLGNAYGQEGLTPPPPNKTSVITPGGVNPVTGDFVWQSTDISIGSDSGASKLGLVRTYSVNFRVGPSSGAYGSYANLGFGFSHNYSVYLNRRDPFENHISLVVLGKPYQFRVIASDPYNYDNVLKDGATLRLIDPAAIPKVFEFIDRDGTKVIFDDSAVYRADSTTDRMFAKYIEFANGEFLTFSYEAARSSGGVSTAARLKSVQNSRGYGLNFSYLNPTVGGSFDRKKLLVSSIAGFRVSCTPNVVDCTAGTLPVVSYSYVDNSSFPNLLATFTDPRGKVTTYQYGVCQSSGCDPQSNAYLVSAKFPENPTVAAFTNHYFRPWVTDGSGNDVQLPARVDYQDDALGNRTTYEYDLNLHTITTIKYPPDVVGQLGRKETIGSSYWPVAAYDVDNPKPVPSSITDNIGNNTAYYWDNYRFEGYKNPEGDTYLQDLDDRGNAILLRKCLKSGCNPTTDIVQTSSFPSCSTANYRICNKPSYTIDGRGNRTDYQYDTSHGGLLVQLAPADASNKRSVLRNTYGSFYSAPLVTVPNGVTMPLAYLMTTADRCLSSTVTGITVDFSFVCPSTDRLRTSQNFTSSISSARTSYELERAVLDPGGLGLTTSYTYDKIGNRLSKDGPQTGIGDKIDFAYDAARNLTLTTYPTIGGVVAKTEQVFDDNGRLEQVKRALGANWATEATAYDVRGLKSSTTGIDGVMQTYTYYNDGLLKDTSKTVDGVARIFRNIYDGAGRLYQVRKAVNTPLEQAYVTWAMDKNGKHISETDANGNVTTNCYDGFNRLIEYRFPSGANATGASPSCTTVVPGGTLPAGVTRETYGYDANDNMTSLTRRGGPLISVAYDANNLMTLKNVPETDGDVTYIYDLAARRKEANLPGSAASLSVVWTYDKADRVKTEASGGRTLTRNYDTGSLWSELQWPDGLHARYNIDGMERVSSIQEISGPSIISYTYDGMSRPTAMARGNSTSSSFSYDAQQRLGSMGHGITGGAVSWSFTYNQAGQAKTLTRDNDLYAWKNHYNVNRAYTPNALNQYTSVAGATFSYDPRGNLTNDGMRAFAYDSDNRLLSAGSVVFAYDAIGRLGRVTSGASITRYLYNDAEIVGEYDGAGNLLRRHVHGFGDDDPVATIEAGGAHSWLYPDYQGSIVAIANSAGGQIAINSYGSWGEDGEAMAGAFGYTGQLRLPGTGLTYYKARVYSPKLGRFLQTDPVGTTDQLNLYAYVANDPINGSDPTGMDSNSDGFQLRGCGTGDCESTDPSTGRSHTFRNGLAAVGAVFGGIVAGGGGAAGGAVLCSPTGPGAAGCATVGGIEGAKAGIVIGGLGGAAIGDLVDAGIAFFNDSKDGVTKHGEERAAQARSGDKSRQVGDPNRVIREGRRFRDSETGARIYVKGDRVVAVGKNGRITQFKNPSANTQARIKSGKWEPQ